MRFSSVVCLLAFLQWQPGLGGCGSGCSNPGPPPPPPKAYDDCGAVQACPSSAPTCVSFGAMVEPTSNKPIGACSRRCTSDSECPAGPGAAQPAVCVVVGNEPAFCTYYYSSDAGCVGYQEPTAAFSLAGRPSTSTAGTSVCVAERGACGDNSCLGTETAYWCPVDCLYASCAFDPDNRHCGLSTQEGLTQCAVLRRPLADGGVDADAGAPDAGAAGICTGHYGTPCSDSPPCDGRGSFAAACVAGLTKDPVCLQSCRAAGQNQDCPPGQRCAAGVVLNRFICVPSSSPF